MLILVLQRIPTYTYETGIVTSGMKNEKGWPNINFCIITMVIKCKIHVNFINIYILCYLLNKLVPYLFKTCYRFYFMFVSSAVFSITKY